MADQINPGFSEALREMGRSVSVDDLRKRGVQRVRSIGMAEVSLLIERAVNRTLLQRTSEVGEEQMGVLAERAKGEFSRQLAGLEELADSRMALDLHRQEMREQMRRLRRELGLRRGFVEGEEEETRVDETLSSSLRLKLQACLLPFLEQGTRPPGPAMERVLANLADVLHAEREEALQRQRDQLNAQAQTLERRIDKLKQSIEESDAAMERLTAAEQADPGVASIYRQSQGLGKGASHRERKIELMSALFEANVELQRPD